MCHEFEDVTGVEALIQPYMENLTEYLSCTLGNVLGTGSGECCFRFVFTHAEGSPLGLALTK